MSPDGMNIRLLATDVGDLIKYTSSINEINRAGKAIFPFLCEHFPNDAITSSRAQLAYDWIMSAGRERMESERRVVLLRQFCEAITTTEQRESLQEILSRCLGSGGPQQELRREFDQRGFHPEVHQHSRNLFCQANYFHAVFEACKAYNKAVRLKAKSDKDGEALMLAVWGPTNGCLKITPCHSETDRNVQDGVRFLSAGLMRAVRNPTAHEPAIHWPISKQDCVDLLAFASFLFRQLDAATYYAGAPKQG